MQILWVCRGHGSDHVPGRVCLSPAVRPGCCTFLLYRCRPPEQMLTIYPRTDAVATSEDAGRARLLNVRPTYLFIRAHAPHSRAACAALVRPARRPGRRWRGCSASSRCWGGRGPPAHSPCAPGPRRMERLARLGKTRNREGAPPAALRERHPATNTWISHAARTKP